MADILNQDEIDALLSDVCNDEPIPNYEATLEKLLNDILDGVKNSTELLNFFNNKNITGNVGNCSITLSLDEVLRVINDININRSLLSKNYGFLSNYSECKIDREKFQTHINELKKDKKILNDDIKKLEEEINNLKKKDLTIKFE